MTDSAFPIQVGVAEALLASSAVTALIGDAIYDPLYSANKPYPLIEIGDDVITTNPDGVTDEASITVHIWADGPGGRLFAKQLADAVRAALAPRPPSLPTIAVANFAVGSAVHHMSRHSIEDDPTDPAGTVAHGVLQFKLQLAPTG